MNKDSLLRELATLELDLLQAWSSSEVSSLQSKDLNDIVRPVDFNRAMDSLIYLSGSIMRVQSNIDALKRMINAHDKSEAA